MTPTTEQLTDRELVAAAGAVIATPKAAPADSFVLHAPLELLARAGLLPFVAPAARERARERISWLAATYEAAGEPLEGHTPTAASRDRSSAAVAGELTAAIGAGDLETVDRLAIELGECATPRDLRVLLAGAIAPSLAAAGHGSILLYLLPRIEAARDVPVGIVRGAARELARHPDWRLHWFDEPHQPGPASFASVQDALLAVPVLGLPGSDFIFPIMNQVEAAGVAAELLSGVLAEPADLDSARRVITRIAAWSMLQESPQYAPYGWTHCLTMAQATLGLAGDGLESRTALAIAATYAAGFRAALGATRLDPSYRPEPPETRDLAESLAAGPKSAAATTWHAPDSHLDTITTELATRAALHHDAHLVKYTLACFDAAATDPAQRRLYLSAAASLSAWWSQQPSDGFFA